MKILKLVAAILLLTLPCSGQKQPAPSDKKATRQTVNLFRSLFELQQKGIMYGHQDDLMYGSRWWY